MSDIKDFTRALFSNWLSGMSGPLSVPAAAAALWVTNDTAKILLGVTAFACLWVTGFRVWKTEHDKVVTRDQAKRQLLDDISGLRQTLVWYRVAMEREVRDQEFDHNVWQPKFDEVEKEIASKIEQLTSKAEATTYLSRGNILRPIDPDTGLKVWPVLIDICIYDLDYLKTFIHDFSRGKDRK